MKAKNNGSAACSMCQAELQGKSLSPEWLAVTKERRLQRTSSKVERSCDAHQHQAHGVHIPGGCVVLVSCITVRASAVPRGAASHSRFSPRASLMQVPTTAPMTCAEGDA